MRKCVSCLPIFVALSLAATARAQECPGELSRQFCMDTAENMCPGEDCLCVDDSLEVVFEANPTCSIFEYTPPLPAEGLRVPSQVVIDVKTDQIRGFSFGVAHDDTAATIVLRDLVIVGTASEPATQGGFVARRVVPGGYILAIVLNFTAPVVLPLGRQVLAKATYTLTRDVGGAGTRLNFTEALGTPPTQVVLTVDKLEFPPMVERDEMNCINNVDDDGDGLTDRDDDDCVVRNGVSRVTRTLIDGLIRGGCTPSGNEDRNTGNSCTDGVDNDCDGMTDAADPGCGCTPTGNEDRATGNSCTDGVDNDCDGMTDAADPGCMCTPTGPEAGNCTDGVDNDCDGQTDGADSDCVTPTTCPNYAFFFGPTATDADHAISGGSFVISGRNMDPALGFQLGVSSTAAGANTNYTFVETLGPDPANLIDLQYVIGQVQEQEAMAGNRAVGPTSLGNITGIVEGAALTPFGTEDLLLVDLTPNVGGAGFTVGYVADITDPGPGGQSNRIPATPPGTPTTCPLNELLVVSFGPPPQQPFSRGDADGNRKLNVTDGILIIQIRIGNIAARFNCDDILDSNDNGIVELSDAVLVLRYVFMDGAPLPPPFRAQCTTDPTDDALICAQGNCTPGA